MEIEKNLLQASVDGYNAGFGKTKRRVSFCKDSGKHVIQEYGHYNSNTKKQWFCLH